MQENTNIIAESTDKKIITLEAGDMPDTQSSQADITWHEVHNAHRTRRILTGTLGGIEQTEDGMHVALVEFKGYRILIPTSEMFVKLVDDTDNNKLSVGMRLSRSLSSMLGAEVDFIVKGIDAESRSVVASRREAMLKKCQNFYIEPSDDGRPLIEVGGVVQARIIAVHEKMLRVEIFGVETAIPARDIAWEWLGDVRDSYSVGATIYVRITEIDASDIEQIKVKAEVKSQIDTSKEKLSRCKIQSKYAGRVIDVHKGVVFIRLTNGVNAVAHSCLDRRMPGKKDDVSFVVTRIDTERGVAVGIITRIIKQNL